MGLTSSPSGIQTSDINTSAKLAAIVTDETGTGALVLANSPTFTGSPAMSVLYLTASNNTIDMTNVTGNAVVRGGAGGVYFNNNANNATNVGWTDAGNVTIRGTTILGTGTSFKNIRHGVSGAMVLGTVTVTDTGCTANTRYFFSAHTLGTITVPGGYYAMTRNAGASVVAVSSQPTETSTLDWLAVEP